MTVSATRLKLESLSTIVEEHSRKIDAIRKNLHDTLNHDIEVNVVIEHINKDLEVIFNNHLKFSESYYEKMDKISEKINALELKIQESIIKRTFIKNIVFFITGHFYKILCAGVLIYFGASDNPLKNFLIELVKRL